MITRSTEKARAHLTDIMIRVGANDQAAMHELYKLTSAKLFGICLSICEEHGAAEDVLHEVYLLVWRGAGSWEPGRASPISWLARVARNRSIDWRRTATRRLTVHDDALSNLADPTVCIESTLIATSEARHVLACLHELEPRQREAIRTAFFDDVTYAEIASRSGVPLGTVKSWIRRGLVAMRTCLRPQK